MGLLALLRRLYKSKVDEARVLFLGLDNAGKTTILRALSDGDITTVTPTQGFHIRSLIHEGFKLNVWDIGGQRAIRPYWRNYFDAFVYVIDCAERHRLVESGDELSLLLEEEKMEGVPLLVLANKQDLPNALLDDEVTAGLHLAEIRDRDWHIQGCSAKSGDGLQEGMDWLLQNSKARDQQVDMSGHQRKSTSNHTSSSKCVAFDSYFEPSEVLMSWVHHKRQIKVALFHFSGCSVSQKQRATASNVTSRHALNFFAK